MFCCNLSNNDNTCITTVQVCTLSGMSNVGDIMAVKVGVLSSHTRPQAFIHCQMSEENRCQNLQGTKQHAAALAAYLLLVEL